MATGIGIGARVSYEDMANPLRAGTITGEVAGQWAVRWDGEGSPLEQDGVEFHATVTKHMLERAAERQEQFRAERRGRCGGWDVLPESDPAGDAPVDLNLTELRAGLVDALRACAEEHDRDGYDAICPRNVAAVNVSGAYGDTDFAAIVVTKAGRRFRVQVVEEAF